MHDTCSGRLHINLFFCQLPQQSKSVMPPSILSLAIVNDRLTNSGVWVGTVEVVREAVRGKCMAGIPYSCICGIILYKKNPHTITSNYLHENRPSLCNNNKQCDPKVMTYTIEKYLLRTFAEITREDTCMTTNTAASKHATFIQQLFWWHAAIWKAASG